MEEDKFTIQLVIGKLEFDGNEVCPFNLLDYYEIVKFEQLESKLKEFYGKGIKKIEEIKNLY